ncbi:hypothetical protein FXF68_20750 [Actinomadura decatromicini]|uniref:Uncharacterized protein n=1 Tax=Actinomadura decatromicini TaxID=2604572 RepID=A0A5D3FJE0_9ACTN|nr:hypothetical protein FXF68_20750 [Actinomadura decatromicini]
MNQLGSVSRTATLVPKAAFSYTSTRGRFGHWKRFGQVWCVRESSMVPRRGRHPSAASPSSPSATTNTATPAANATTTSAAAAPAYQRPRPPVSPIVASSGVAVSGTRVSAAISVRCAVQRATSASGSGRSR